jgi:hypothetical protein
MLSSCSNCTVSEMNTEPGALPCNKQVFKKMNGLSHEDPNLIIFLCACDSLLHPSLLLRLLQISYAAVVVQRPRINYWGLLFCGYDRNKVQTAPMSS